MLEILICVTCDRIEKRADGGPGGADPARADGGPGGAGRAVLQVRSPGRSARQEWDGQSFVRSQVVVKFLSVAPTILSIT